MRFMMLMIPKGYEKAKPGFSPTKEMVEAMLKYNEQLQKAGVLLSLDGLHPTSTGARITFSRGQATRTDGPFPGLKETLGGFWLIQVKSREEAIQWAMRCPAQDGDVIEVRQVQEISDFPPEIQKVVSGSQLGVS